MTIATNLSVMTRARGTGVASSTSSVCRSSSPAIARAPAPIEYSNRRIGPKNPKSSVLR